MIHTYVHKTPHVWCILYDKIWLAIGDWQLACFFLVFNTVTNCNKRRQFVDFQSENIVHSQCLHKRNSALRTWSLKALQNETFWVKCGLNVDPLLSFCGFQSYFHQNSKSSLKSVYLQHCTFHVLRVCVHYGRTVRGGFNNPSHGNCPWGGGGIPPFPLTFFC